MRCPEYGLIVANRLTLASVQAYEEDFGMKTLAHALTGVPFSSTAHWSREPARRLMGLV